MVPWSPSRRPVPAVMNRRVATGIQATDRASVSMVGSSGLDWGPHRATVYDDLRSRTVPVAALLPLRPPSESTTPQRRDLGRAERIRDHSGQVRPMIGHAPMPLFDLLLQESNFPNHDLCRQISHGRSITRTPGPGGARALRTTPAESPVRALLEGFRCLARRLCFVGWFGRRCRPSAPSRSVGWVR